MQRLIIRLGTNIEDPIHWLVFSDQENEIIASGQLQSAAELPSLKERASNAEMIALAPASDIYFAKVDLPKKGARKVIGAIPFMIEEELASNIDSLFFALGDNQDDKQDIAVIAKTTMAEWQDTLSNAGLFCPVLVPDAQCLPSNDGISLVQIGQQLLVKMPDDKYLQGEVSWLLPLALEQAQKQALSLYCYSEIDNWPADQNAQFVFDQLPMQLLLDGAKQSKLNLFQGEYAVRRKANPTWDKWKIAASLAAVAISLNLIFTATELSAIKSERADVREQTAQAVKQGFPQMGNYRFLRTAVEKEMLKLEQGGGDLSMLAMLTRLVKPFEASGVKPQNIRFDAKRSELRMQSVAKSFEALDKFKRDAQGLGFEVEQGAINNRGDEVVGVIVVKG